MTSGRFDDMVAIGRVVKPQGRHGEVAVDVFTDRPDRFPGLRQAYLPGPNGTVRAVAVTSAWPHKGRYVLKLEGVDSIDDAERLRGQDLRIAEEDLAALPEGSFYHHQLKGLRAVDAEGRALGTVTDLLETGGGVVLVLSGGPTGELMVPLVQEFLEAVDLAGGRVVLRPPRTVEAR